MSEPVNDLIRDHGQIRVSDGSTIEGLIQQWRKEADVEAERLKRFCFGGDLDGDMLDDDIEKGFVMVGERRKCADELEAVLSSDPSSRVRKEENTETSQ